MRGSRPRQGRPPFRDAVNVEPFTGVRAWSATPVFFWLDMSATQENREAIQEMTDAEGADISVEDQRELLEQAIVNAGNKPQRIRSASGEEILYPEIEQLIAAEKHVAAKAAATGRGLGLSFIKLIPPGCG